MSKTVKEMLVRDYRERIGDIEDATLISIRGVDANSNNALRSTLRKKDIRVVVTRNSLARRAFEGTGLAPLGDLMKGSSALAFGAESVVEVARELIELVKLHPEMELKGAVLDGELFEGEAGVKRLSDFPTRDEAIAQAVTLIVSPGRKLLGQLKGPGGNLLGVVKAIEEKLEKGEEIKPVA